MATRASSEIDRIALFKCTSSENFTSPIDRRADYYRQRAREDVDADQADAFTGKLPPAQPLLTIPNSLTIFRIALVPFLVVAYLHSSPSAPLLAAATFCLAAITDWADGYLARRLRIASAFGAFLDPVADKIMVATAMVLLAVRPPPGLSQEQVLMPVLISIMREIAMSSLREWAAKSSSQASKRIAVNALGKWKTALQMVGICSMYVWRDQDHLFGPKMGGTAATFLQYGPEVSLAMLWLASFFSVWSLSCYMQSIWLFFKYPDGIRPLKGT